MIVSTLFTWQAKKNLFYSENIQPTLIIENERTCDKNDRNLMCKKYQLKMKMMRLNYYFMMIQCKIEYR